LTGSIPLLLMFFCLPVFFYIVDSYSGSVVKTKI
jgi:hypothetical protein